METSRDVRMISFDVQVVRHAERLPARADDHGDLLQRAVARPLADAVDRDLHLPRAVLDPGQRVRDRQAQIVVAVRRDDDVVGRSLAHDAHQFTELGGGGVAHGVGNVDRRRPALDRDAEALEQEVQLGPGGVLRGELHVVGVAHGELHVVADRVQHLPVRHAEHVLHGSGSSR